MHVAACTHHIGLYPLPVGELTRDVAGCSTAKGTPRYALGSPVPYDLVARIGQALAREPSGN